MAAKLVRIVIATIWLLVASELLHKMTEVKACAREVQHSSENRSSGLVDYSVIITGATGSGKSQASNFFMEEEVFTSKWSLKPVTNTSVSCTRYVGGKCLKVVDTPGFLDPFSLSNTTQFRGLAEAIIDMPNGINAVGLVINIQSRITKADANLLEKLLTMKEMIPYSYFPHLHTCKDIRKYR